MLLVAIYDVYMLSFSAEANIGESSYYYRD